MINLDSIGGAGAIRARVRRRHAALAVAGLPADDRAHASPRKRDRLPARASALRQLDRPRLSVRLYEQAPFLSQRHRCGHADDRRRQSARASRRHRRSGLSAGRLAQVGRAAQDSLGTLDEGLEFTQGTSSYLYLGSRIIRGWAVELVLIACLLPFLGNSGRSVRALPAAAHPARARRSARYRSRLGFWAWVVGLFELFGAARRLA